MTDKHSSAREHAREAADSMRHAMEELRATVERKFSTRTGKGGVRAAILTVLQDEPMHGYQIIRTIEERTDGAWKPSAGSIYPTLQMLADEGLVESDTATDRKVYTLTSGGRAAAEQAQPPWEHNRYGAHAAARDLTKAGVELAQAAATAFRSGSNEQQEAVTEALHEARRRIYSILAKD